MFSPHDHLTGARRRAVTLIELILTLCLLVVIAALAVPALDKPFANQRLRTAADKVRVAWCRARVDAIRTGRVHAFRYAVEGDRYCCEPLAEPSVFDEPFAPVEAVATDPVVAVQPAEEKLPEGITFVASETLADTREMMFATDTQTSGQASGQAPLEIGSAWSAPILFYPDGTSSTAVLRLKNDSNRCVDLELRGLTGVVKVGELFSDEVGL